MIDPVALVMARARDGLYESFYFRGNSRDGRHAFWLKHNLLRRHGERGVSLEIGLILYDRDSGEVQVAHDREDMSPQAFNAFARSRNWESLSGNMASGSFFAISRERLNGRLHTARGHAAWDLALQRSDEVLYHFPHSRLYQLPLPKKKILTRDSCMSFSGMLRVGDVSLSGDFVGVNGHNWGTEHAHEYAYAGCNLFREDADACFDGFSARLALAAGLVRTPHLSLAALRLDGEWHHFNALSRCYQQDVRMLSDFHWSIVMKNDTHTLELSVDGGNPRLLPWVALNYSHPGGARSVVKNTKFARGRLRLATHEGEAVAELNSDCFELETLLPANIPGSSAYVDTP
ncbi:MAG: hypothetical protein REI12_11155 [Pedobacter sp.]|nr:hypothetical protein [Pedobacter sp.]